MAITVGNSVVDRANGAGTSDLVIDLNTQCDGDGTINTVACWLLQGGTVYVAMFQDMGNSVMHCRSVANLGYHAAGYHEALACSIEAKAGDYIGISVAGGRVEMDTTAGTSWSYRAGTTPVADQFYPVTFQAGHICSIRADGDSYVPPTEEEAILDELNTIQDDYLPATNQWLREYWNNWEPGALILAGIVRDALAGGGGGGTGVTLAQLQSELASLTADLEQYLDTKVADLSADIGVSSAPATGLMAALTQAEENIRTDSEHSIAVVESAISQLDAPDLSAITSAISDLDGDLSSARAAIIGDIDSKASAVTSDVNNYTDGRADDIDAAIAAIPTVDLGGVLTAISDGVSDIEGAVTSTEGVILNALAALDFAAGWPGLANVTTDPPVALSDGLVIDTACDGILVNITTPPTKTGLYAIGDTYYDYKEGLVAFETDNGYMEMWQYLGFRQAVYTPKSMKTASKVHFQVLAGAAGNVITWRRA